MIEACDKWWEENKSLIADQVKAVLNDNKFKIMAKAKSKEDFVAALEARGIPEHIALIARDLF